MTAMEGLKAWFEEVGVFVDYDLIAIVNVSLRKDQASLLSIFCSLEVESNLKRHVCECTSCWIR